MPMVYGRFILYPYPSPIKVKNLPYTMVLWLKMPFRCSFFPQFAEKIYGDIAFIGCYNTPVRLLNSRLGLRKPAGV